MRETLRAACVVAVMGCLLAPRSARACSGYSFASAPLFRADAAIPANARGLPFELGAFEVGVDAGPVARLLDGGGHEVAATIDPALSERSAGEHLLVPSAPLLPGPYALEIADSVQSGGRLLVPFTVVPAAPLPLAAVTANASRSSLAFTALDFTTDGSCYSERWSSVIDVTVSVAEDYRPYLALARFEPNPGAAELSHDRDTGLGPDSKPVSENLTYAFRVAHRCDGKDFDTEGSFRVRVFGVDAANAVATIPLHFEACDARPDAAAGAAHDADAARRASGDGCSLSPRASGAPPLLGLLAAGLALRQRRRVRGADARPCVKRRCEAGGESAAWSATGHRRAANASSRRSK